MQEKLLQLQKVLEHEIPLSRAIGIEARDYDGESLTLAAPLDKNINHKSTAFGGSLYSVAVLSGWGLIYLLLQEHGLGGHIVIQESEIKYLRPVDGELVAKAQVDAVAALPRFLKLYRRSGRARIRVHARIHHGGELAVDFSGQYVVHL